MAAKQIRAISIGLLCWVNVFSLSAQEQTTFLNKLLVGLSGSLSFSIKDFNGTELLSEYVFDKDVLQTKTGNWKKDIASVIELQTGNAATPAMCFFF